MEDSEDLEELKKQRMDELEDESEEQREQQREQIRNLASEYLTKDAKSRLGNIRAADPELASAIEAQVAQLGRSGRMDEMGDEELKQILKDVRGSKEDTDIKFRR